MKIFCKKIKNKKGFTLVEIMVASILFVIVISMAIGGFIAMNRARILVGTMKETQQKLRVSMEMISRLAKEADSVSVYNSLGSQVPSGGKGNSLELFYNIDSTVNKFGRKFTFDTSVANKGRLQYYTCSNANVNTNTFPITCNVGGWVFSENILGDDSSQRIMRIIEIEGSSYFQKISGYPVELFLNIKATNEFASGSSVTDTMSVENTVILEGL